MQVSGQLKHAGVGRYVNEITVDLGDHMETMRNALISFVEVGVPTIRFAQQHTANGNENGDTGFGWPYSWTTLLLGLSNLSTVATFFSGACLLFLDPGLLKGS